MRITVITVALFAFINLFLMMLLNTYPEEFIANQQEAGVAKNIDELVLTIKFNLILLAPIVLGLFLVKFQKTLLLGVALIIFTGLLLIPYGIIIIYGAVRIFKTDEQKTDEESFLKREHLYLKNHPEQIKDDTGSKEIDSPLVFFATKGVTRNYILFPVLIVALWGLGYSFSLGLLSTIATMFLIIFLIQNYRRSKIPALKVDTTQDILTLNERKYLFSEIKSWGIENEKELVFSYIPVNAEADQKEQPIILTLKGFESNVKDNMLSTLEKVFSKPLFVKPINEQLLSASL